MNPEHDPRRDDEIKPDAPRADDDEIIELDPPDDAPPPPRTIPPPHTERDPVSDHTETDAKPKTKPETAPADKPEEAPLVRPGLGGSKAALIVGVLLLVGAMIAAALRVSGLQNAGFSDSTLAVFYVLYMTLLHTLTGFAALLVASKVAGRELGRAELGAARMLVAVAAFALVANLNIPIPTRLDELALAAIAYTLIVWGANRLSRLELGVVVIAHALILIIVALGSVLDGAYSDAVSELGPPKPREVAPAETAPTQTPTPEPAP